MLKGAIILVLGGMTFFIAMHFIGQKTQDPHDLLALNDSNSKNLPFQDVSFIIEPIIKEYNIPGMAVAVLHGDSISAMGVAGVRVRGFPEKITIGDEFHIGSCTKAMTAFLCAFLVEEGVLNWNTKVIDLFPEISKTINPGFKDLSLQQLLTNRGGVVANLDFHVIQQEAKGNLVLARQLVMEKALSIPPEVKPGTFLYSNTGFVIAGHMAEKATGEAWENLMKTHIFIPIEMTTAGFGAPESKLPRGVPWGHRSDGSAVPPGKSADNPETMGPAGTVHCSIGDWAKFIKLELLGAEGKARYLKLNSYKKLQEPVTKPPPSYAMGWVVQDRDWAKGKTLYHNGSNTYWYAEVWIAPAKDFAVLVVCNQDGEPSTKACDKASWELVQHFLKHK